MECESLVKPKKVSQQDYDIISNQITSAIAQRESLIKTWTASSKPTLPRKAQVEFDVEDEALFQKQPPHLGIGAPIPSDFLVSAAQRTTKTLRAKLFGSNGLKASKARDTDEKAASAKRGPRDDSSEEEQGRTSLGRKKKLKINTKSQGKKPLPSEDAEQSNEDQKPINNLNERNYGHHESQSFKELSQHSDNNVRQALPEDGGKLVSSDNEKFEDLASPMIEKEMPFQELSSSHHIKPEKISYVVDQNEHNKVHDTRVVLDTLQDARITNHDPEPANSLDSAAKRRLKKREKKKRHKLKAAMASANIT